MAKKSGVTPNEVQSWLARVKRAERIRGEADDRYGYSRSLKMYQGDFRSVMPSFLTGVDIIPINEIYSYAKTFVPSIYSRDPYITVNPTTAESIAGAKIMELAINAYWRGLRLKRVIRQVIYDAVFAEGWVKTGYSAAFGSIEQEDGKPGLEISEFVKDEEIFAVRVSWRNMVKDPDAVDGIYDARWVAQQIIRPIDAVQASSIYENTRDIRPAFIVQNDHLAGTIGPADEQKYAVLWEIWDRDLQKVYTISEGASDYLMNKDWPYEMEGYPFELLRFVENPDEAYAPNLITSWEPQLWEKMKLRAIQMDHLKRFSRQLFVEKGALSRSEIDKFTKGLTASVIQVEPKRLPPQPIPYPPIQTDIYGVESRIDLDKDNVSGQPNAVRSAPQRTQTRTLGEIDRLISAFQARQGEPQTVMEDFSAEVALNLLELMGQYQDAPKYVKATQKDMGAMGSSFIDAATGKPRFDGFGFTFTKKDIRDIEYQVNVKAGSTLPLDKQNRIESMVNILKLGPTIGVQPGDKVSRVIGKNLIGEFEMPEITSAYDEQLHRMEVAETMQRVAAKADNSMTQMKIASLKAQHDRLNAATQPGAPAMPGNGGGLGL